MKRRVLLQLLAASPLGVGKVSLADGTTASGFLCEGFALEGAPEITALGSWRAYIAGLAAG